MEIDVIIPLYKPGKELFTLFKYYVNKQKIYGIRRESRKNEKKNKKQKNVSIYI